jgi:hypothetical protein
MPTGPAATEPESKRFGLNFFVFEPRKVIFASNCDGPFINRDPQDYIDAESNASQTIAFSNNRDAAIKLVLEPQAQQKCKGLQIMNSN